MTQKMKDANLEKGFSLVMTRHKQRMSDRNYYQRWILKNATAQNLRNGNRPKITLPKLAFMERPELFPEI